MPELAEFAETSHAAAFRIWFSIGIQSFGGGVATLTLINRAIVVQRRWLTEDEFVRDWALCQIAPGINLLAIAILIGRRVGGFVGALVALAGLLLPSAADTILMTAIYRDVAGSPVVQHALRGLIPGSIGLGVVTAYGMAKAPILQDWREGWGSLAIAVFILVASGVAVMAQNWPVLAALAAAGAAHAFWSFVYERRHAAA